ncbi:hypothetical protein Rs2_29099 [Raphanus sativus]|nr:hypothetical protein Rs2_29099 [Raphanus sativus]
MYHLRLRTDAPSSSPSKPPRTLNFIEENANHHDTAAGHPPIAEIQCRLQLKTQTSHKLQAERRSEQTTTRASGQKEKTKGQPVRSKTPEKLTPSYKPKPPTVLQYQSNQIENQLQHLREQAPNLVGTAEPGPQTKRRRKRRRTVKYGKGRRKSLRRRNGRSRAFRMPERT